jgi:hypothetical protein
MLASSLNGDCHAAVIDRAALDAALHAQGEDFFRRVADQNPHLFADAAYFISAAHMARMREVIEAVERVVKLPAWERSIEPPAARQEGEPAGTLGVFMGYDFHLDAQGVHLIEINTNAGGAFLNALLLDSQRHIALPGAGGAPDDPERVFLDMFRNEWRLARGAAQLQTVAIVDEAPQGQYLYPEFVLAQRMFERAGIAALIADPAELEARGEGLFSAGRRVDLVYNRLTDFSLQQYPALLAAHRRNQVVLTPDPRAYARYADKRNLARLTDADGLRAIGVPAQDIAILQAGIPETRLVHGDDAGLWWSERKLWFFKPVSGFGGRGTYRGGGVTQRVFGEIVQGGYVAQRLAPPGERMVCPGQGAEAVPMKADVRCYVYGGDVQLIAARLYQGQTTNFRTAGGGFAQIRLVG